MFENFENLDYPNLENVRPIILASGAGSATKYSASFDRFMNSTLIETIYTLLKFSFQKDPIIICADREKFENLEGLKDAIIISDQFGHSTLGAVRTAFANTLADNLFVIGSHNPFISIETASRMMAAKGDALAVVPVLNGNDICMHAIYDRRLIPIMDKKLAEGETLLHSFYNEIHLVQLPIAEDDKSRYIFTDLYTPEDLRYGEEKFKELRP